MNKKFIAHVATETRKYVGLPGLAQRYDISERSVSELCRRKILPKIKIGRIVRFDVDACDAAIKKFQIQSSNN